MIGAEGGFEQNSLHFVAQRFHEVLLRSRGTKNLKPFTDGKVKSTVSDPIKRTGRGI